MQLKSDFVVFLHLILIRVIECETEDQMEVKAHPIYKDLKCNYPKVNSVAKLRDNKYFLSTNGQKFWLVDDNEFSLDSNSRDLKTITTEWHKIDASFYYGLNLECGLQFRDKLILVNYNHKTQRNEVIVGSLSDWKWTSMVWSDFNAFKVTEKHIDWKKSIDGIAIVEETLFLFQDKIRIRVDCNYRNDKWVYEVMNDFKEIPISGRVEAVYAEDKSRDTYPLHIIRGEILFICYIKEDNDEFPTCDQSAFIDYPMFPTPICFVDNDPNAPLKASLIVQMIILWILVISLIIFSSIYLWNMWKTSNSDTIIDEKDTILVKGKKTTKTDVKETKNPDKNKKESPKS